MVRIIVYNKRGVVVVAVVFLLIAGAEKNCPISEDGRSV
jgi:hypothetical protein